MNCSQVTDCFPAFLYGDLPPEETARVQDHLSGCPACRRELTALQEVRQLLDRLPPPADVRIDLPKLYRQQAEQHQRRLRRWRRLAGLSMGAAAVVLLTLTLRLEVRLEGHQAAVGWGTPPTAASLPEPPAPPPSLVATLERHREETEAKLQLLHELTHALAAEMDARD